MEDFSKWLNSTVDNSVANAQPSLQSTTPYTKYASPDVDRFRFQDNFKSEGFNPFDEANNARWSSRETVWSALGKGFDQFGSRFSNTFVDYWKDWGRLGDALVSWDLSKMMPSESEMMRQYMEDQREQMKNYVFAKPGTEDDIFTRKTVSEFIGNAGFALGSFSGFAIELAVDAVITYFSAGAGAGSIGATIGRLGSKFGLKSAAKTVAKEGVEEVAKQAAKRSAFSINDIVTGYNLGNQSTDAIRATGKVSKGIEDAAKVSKMAGTDAAREAAKEASRVMALNLDAIIKSKSFTELSANIVKGIPVVGSLFTAGEKAAVGAKAGLSAGKVIGIGLSGVRRAAQEINRASTEASFEAIQTYGETLEQMAAKYQSEHDGIPPDFAEFEKMKRLAGQASFSNYKTNLAILLATNRLQFGTMFNKINITNKWFSDVLSETGAKAFGVKSMFKGTKEVFKVYEKSKFLGTYGLIGKIAKDFGKKQAIYVLGKTLAKNTLKFQVTEGLQENIQEASAMAWRDFYLSQYDETGLTLDKAFEQGLESQWSKQGLKTFMMGAFTGMLVSGPTALMMKGVEGVSNAAINKQYKNTPSENPLKQAKEQLLRDIDTMNLVGSWLSDSKKSDMKLFNFNSQLNSAMGMTEAAAANNDYEYHNHKDNALIAGALAANRTGMIDAYTQSIRSMGEEMTDQEFEEAFGIKLQDTKYKSAREFTNTVADELKKYSDVIDGLRKKIKNLADPLMYAENSKDRAIAAIMRNTQENALHVIAINQLKGIRAGERAKQLTDELLSIPSLANSSNMILRILSDPSTFKKEMGNILADIQFMKNNLKAEGVTADKKAELEEKIALRERELELFKKWRTYYSKRVVTSTNEEIIKKKVKETNAAGEEVEVEVEEKVPHSVEEVFDDRFVGKRAGVEKVKETPDSPIEEKEIFDLYDAEVKETFRQLVNSRNKQAGLNIEVREQDLVDDFKKVVDYLQLTHDERSYIRAIDSLFNQKNLQQFLERMADGDFKYRLIMFMSNLNNRINQTIAEIFQNNDTIGQEFKDLAETINNAQEEGRELSVVEALSNMRGWEAFKIFIDLTEEVINDIRNSAAWKNLVLVSIDENLGIQQSTLVHDSAQIVEKALKEKLAELVEKYSTGDVVKIKAEEDARKEADKPKPVNPEVISDEEFSLFTDPDNPEVSTERLQSIANKINQGGTTTLSPREIKIYEVHKTEIDNLNNPEEQPVSTDIEAKKADIERRRQEELEYWQAEDRQKRIKEGRETTKKVLENLKKKYPATTFQGIAIRLLEKIIDFNTFAIINSEGLRLPGGQDATKFGALATGEGMAMRQDRIDALLAGDVNAVKTFIHELVHTFTKEKVGEYQMEKSGLIPGYKAKLTEKEKQAVAELERIYNKVKAQFPSSTEYGLTNLDEFLAEAFSNDSFQGTLKEIKAEGKKTSLFKEWLNAVVDLFYAGLEKWAKRFNKEIPNKSEVSGILEDVMAWTEDLIDDKLIKLEVTTEEINAKYDAELAALEQEESEIKVATDVNPEARTILNSLGYSNTMIDSLSREERARILTNKIPVEDYQSEQDSHIVVEEDPEGNVSIKDGENDLVIETADSVENGIKRKAELDELKQQYDDVAKLIGEHSSQQLITAALEFLQDLWNNRNANKKPIGFKEFINQKSTKKRVEKFLKDNITTEEPPAPVGLFDKPIPDGLPNTTDIPTGVVAVRLNSESLAKIEEAVKTFKLTIDNSKENRNFVSSTSKKTPQEILARLKEVSNCV